MGDAVGKKGAPLDRRTPPPSIATARRRRPCPIAAAAGALASRVGSTPFLFAVLEDLPHGELSGAVREKRRNLHTNSERGDKSPTSVVFFVGLQRRFYFYSWIGQKLNVIVFQKSSKQLFWM